VVTLAIFALSEGDVDCLGVCTGFGEKPEPHIPHHAVDKTLALQSSVWVCLGADPHVWDVEGETGVCHSGNIHRAAELLLDLVNVPRLFRRIDQVGTGDEFTVESVGVGHVGLVWVEFV
jgi:hypothetical protein